MNRNLLFLIILAIILRLPQLGGSFWLDEAAQALESARPFSEQLLIVDDFQPPLIHFLVHFAQYFSHREFWLRLWAAFIPGIVTIIFTYTIGKKLFSEKTGIIAALLLATSSFHIFYSQELRPYALPACFAILTWNWLLEQKKLSRKSQIGFVFATAAGLYSSYLYPFVIFSQAAFLLKLSAPVRKQMIVLFSLAALMFLPWLPSFLGQLNAGQLLRSELPGWETVVSTPQLKSLPLLGGKFFYGVIEIDFSILFLIPILITLGIALVNFYKPGRSHQLNISNSKKNALVGLALWGFASIFVAWLISFVVPVLQPKRVLFALPAIYLLVAYFFTNQSEKSKQKLNLVTLLLLFAINIFGTWQYYTQPKLQRENWRGLISELKSTYPEQDSIMIFSFPEAFAPLRWYPHNYKTISTGKLSTSDVPDLADLLKPVVEYDYVLTFDYLSDLTDSQKLIPKTIESFGFKEVGYLDYPGIGFIRVFSKTESVTAYAHRN